MTLEKVTLPAHSGHEIAGGPGAARQGVSAGTPGTAWIDPQTGSIAKIEAGIADTLGMSA